MKKHLCLILCILIVVSMISCGEKPVPVTTAPPTEPADPIVTVPPVSDPIATEPAPSYTDPTTVSTEPPETAAETQPPETDPPATEPSIQDSPAYQKLCSIYNADCFDSDALEAFARWIDSQDGFMEHYPNGWTLSDLWKGCELTCFSPKTEDSRYYGFWIRYSEEDGTLEICREPYAIHAMDITRDEVAQMVYSAEDPIGVPDGMKEGFIDFLLYHDMYPASLFWPHYTTEWYFDWKTYAHEDSSSDEFITLFIEVRQPDDEPGEYDLCSVFFNGTHIMEGWLDYHVTGETSTQPTVAP